MNQKEKVSIIMPAYKAEKVIEKAIKSVLNQTYKNIELIIIENGPKDNSEQICKKLNNDGNIKYIYENKAGVSNARNVGISKSTGKYIAFIDSDDEYKEDFIEKMVANIKNTNSQLVTCGYITVYEKIVRQIEDYKKIEKTNQLKEYLEILKEGYLFNEVWNKLYITEIIKENNIKFDENIELGEDFIFNLDYYRYVQTATYINESLYIYTDGQFGLKLKYRADKFEIEYYLTKYLEKIYKEKEWDMDYIYNRFARVYYNGIIDIYKPNNPASKEEKEKQLETFIQTEQYKKELNFLKDKITDKKFKLAVKYFFLKGKKMIKLFVIINNIRKGR